MQKDTHLTIAMLDDEQESECLITSARQIQSLLRKISETRSRTALYFDDAQDFIITTLLDVGDEGFWVEQGTDMPKNRRIAESKKITLVSSLDQVKVQFSATGANAVVHQGYQAYFLPLPASLYRVQRREYFRVMHSLSERLHCIIPINKPQAGGRIELPVMDISGSGVKLSCAENDIELVPGETYPGCQINLPDVGKISVTLLVRNLIPVSPQTGHTIKFAGCEFKNLDNASSILLQRYITKIQRSKNDV